MVFYRCGLIHSQITLDRYCTKAQRPWCSRDYHAQAWTCAEHIKDYSTSAQNRPCTSEVCRTNLWGYGEKRTRSLEPEGSDVEIDHWQFFLFAGTRSAFWWWSSRWHDRMRALHILHDKDSCCPTASSARQVQLPCVQSRTCPNSWTRWCEVSSSDCVWHHKSEGC